MTRNELTFLLLSLLGCILVGVGIVVTSLAIVLIPLGLIVVLGSFFQYVIRRQ